MKLEFMSCQELAVRMHGLERYPVCETRNTTQRRAGTLARATAGAMLLSQLAVYQPQTVVWMLISHDVTTAPVHVCAPEKLDQAPHADNLGNAEYKLTFLKLVIEA